MTRSLRAVLTLFAAFGLAGAASVAQAQCPPNAGFCADLSASGSALVQTGRGAQIVITVGPVRPPPPPQIVVVRPPPPPQVVYVRPPPPPPVVYVRPQPQVVYQQQPQVIYQQQPQVYQQPMYYQRAQISRNVSGTTGLRFFVGGAGGGGTARLGGMGAALRIRPTEHFAVDIGAGVYGGSDHYGHSRVEIPVTADALYFVNPQSRGQFYLVGGLGASFAYSDFKSTGILARSYTYLGASAGAGIELRITRGFALNFDMRGFIRGQTRATPAEFQRTASDGSTQTTRTSAGVIGQLGATLYF